MKKQNIRITKTFTKIKLNSLILIPLLFVLSSCFQLGQYSEDGSFEVSLGESDLQYVPSTVNHLDDSVYMGLIDNLIEEKTQEISSDSDFLRIAKAIAWTETTWKHYYEINGRYYVHLGDNGNSFGIMQIHQEYHGQHPILQENLQYGINFADEKYSRAKNQNCDTGTNKGLDIVGIARRAYAQYNGGNGAMCRDNDSRDNNLETAYYDEPWLDYM
jgi:hypothetical protein